MIEVNELKNKVAVIDTLVCEKITSQQEDLYPIRDGIIDVEKYLSAKYRVMWILKEPYEVDEDGNPNGGGWDFKEVINSKETIGSFGKARRTFQNITYTVWSILNGFCQYKDIPSLDENPEMLNALKSIAFINVKKLPGTSTSVDYIIGYAYNDCKDILLKQISDYNPQIIIGGSTLHHFFNDLEILKEKMITHGSSDYVFKENRLFIDAFHPAQRTGITGVSDEQYCNHIIEIAKEWASN